VKDYALNRGCLTDAVAIKGIQNASERSQTDTLYPLTEKRAGYTYEARLSIDGMDFTGFYTTVG
jgi:hypothetical protein